MMEPQMGLTFEQVWASIQELRDSQRETGQQLKESEAAFDRELKESKAEFDRRMKESKAEFDRQLKESNRKLNRSIGKLGNKFGDLVEHLIKPKLIEKFNTLGYVFTKAGPRVVYKDAATKRTIAEVDVLLENGDYVLAVEVKAAPDIEDVREHSKRMEILRGYADEHGDKRVYLGAVAGAVFSEAMKNFTLKCGFYVLEQSGDTVQILATPESWKPKAW
jgi:hypothetical protein